MDIKNLNTPVAENVKRIISETGLKQYVVANRIGCSAQELTDMICGRRIIKVNDIPKLGAALGVDIGALFQEPREEKAM